MSESSPAAGADAPVVDTTTETTTPETGATNSDASAAASSTAEKGPATMLDAVKAAIEPKGDTPSPKSTDQPADGEDPDSTKAKTETEDELSPEEVKALSTRTQQRFSKLTKNLKAASAEITSLKPKAEEFDKIDTFVRNAGLSPQDVAGTLEIAALLRSPRPQDALARLMPIVDRLREISGETLPVDLQQRVDQGYLTEADAKTLAKAQADARLATNHVTQVTERQQVDNRNREFRELTTDTIGKVTSWEATQAARDPDWHLKRDNVAELVELAIERRQRELGRPYFPTAAEAIKFSEDAMKTVNDRTKRFGPKPTEIKPIGSGGASPRSTAVPKTMLDVVRQNVGVR